jgi:sortase A
MRSQPLRLMQALFLVTGLLSVGYVAYIYAALYVSQESESRRLDRAMTTRHQVVGLPIVQRPQRGSLMGKIVIPRLGIAAMVREGADAATLRLAAGHIPSTALPGQTGNVGVSAHRDTLFRNLKDAQINDGITLTTPEGDYFYQVVSLAVVEPTEVSVLAPSSNQRTLTLVTCYPFYYVGPAPKRFIVRALQLMPQTEHPTVKRPVTAGVIAPVPIAIHFNAGPTMER